jgi:hypothetical protein
VRREEIADIIKPDAFSPFVLVTGSGSRFSVHNPDFVDLPPIPEEADPDVPSFMIVYTKNGVPRFIALENISRDRVQAHGSVIVLCINPVFERASNTD